MTAKKSTKEPVISGQEKEAPKKSQEQIDTETAVIFGIIGGFLIIHFVTIPVIQLFYPHLSLVAKLGIYAFGILVSIGIVKNSILKSRALNNQAYAK